MIYWLRSVDDIKLEFQKSSHQKGAIIPIFASFNPIVKLGPIMTR